MPRYRETETECTNCTPQKRPTQRPTQCVCLTVCSAHAERNIKSHIIRVRDARRQRRALRPKCVLVALRPVHHHFAAADILLCICLIYILAFNDRTLLMKPNQARARVWIFVILVRRGGREKKRKNTYAYNVLCARNEFINHVHAICCGERASSSRQSKTREFATVRRRKGDVDDDDDAVSVVVVSRCVACETAATSVGAD